MTGYKDQTWCSNQRHTPDCTKQFTQQDHQNAEKWWGGTNYPIAWGPRCNPTKETK